jgi:hypothetical protein
MLRNNVTCDQCKKDLGFILWLKNEKSKELEDLADPQ